MRIEEICIGDLFRYRFKDSFNKEIVLTFHVSHIDPSLGSYCIWSEEYGRVCYIENLEPIELTPEILEKNGWERCVSSITRTDTASFPICKSNQFSHKELPGMRLCDESIHHFTLLAPVFGKPDKRQEIHQIYYIHELQHCFTLLKINKQIEL